jgi:hypothetical protein
VSEKLAEGLSAELREVLVPLLKEIESLNEPIKEYDQRMEKIAKEVYPERTTEAHQQRRRPVSANDDGAGSTLHSGAIWRRQ